MNWTVPAFVVVALTGYFAGRHLACRSYGPARRHLDALDRERLERCVDPRNPPWKGTDPWLEQHVADDSWKVV